MIQYIFIMHIYIYTVVLLYCTGTRYNKKYKNTQHWVILYCTTSSSALCIIFIFLYFPVYCTVPGYTTVST